ncbi:hypothetical protein KKC83_02935 [Patescibacteria group bacterium]|nr:hypothetical protein [Patescibacteria group bacterium]MBU4026473.1 hypothetical protein [Patescibacteria group bacterium]MBU4125284.1 hypothetical protein [Patescibacteria group bacterium]MCG2697761.1 hypothetical protein [Candidatus Parcubacteria bacterium]
MNKYLFQRTAKYWNDWACQSVKLVKDFLVSDITEDEPRFRSYYILLSYAFELMLKSRLVMVTNISEDELIKIYGHDVKKILQKLKDLNELKNIGIKDLPEVIKQYIYKIETTDSKIFYIYDFTNIRYYPKEDKDSWETANIILCTADIMLSISNKIRAIEVK